MIFESLVLHNVGVYRGEHAIDLKPRNGQPVILVGALNGAGKTTLLEATQLALYGRATTASTRGAQSYPNYLLQLINKDTDPTVGASVSLTFRHRTHGIDERFQVTRTWRKSGQGVKEEVQVLRDDSMDSEATDRWLEYVEQILPVQLADLFLFDGERIESLADPERASEFLRTAIHALLGLDVVDNLSRSLAILERRKLSRAPDTVVLHTEYQAAESDLSINREAIASAHSTAASVRTEIDGVEQKRRRVARALAKDGGELFDKREQILLEARQAQDALAACSAELIEIAAGEAPLHLVSELIEEARLLTDGVRRLEVAKAAQDSLERCGQEICRVLRSLKVPKTSVAKIDAIVNRHMGMHEVSECDNQAIFIGNQWTAIAPLDGELPKQIVESLRNYRKRASALRASEDRIASIPEEASIKAHVDHLKELDSQLLRLRTRLEICEEDLARLQREAEKLVERVRKANEALGLARLEGSNDERIVLHSKRARETLQRFRQEVISRNVQRVERLVLDRIGTLLRKGRHLISSVKIDETDFRLRLFDDVGREIEALTLSAGERQLLAVALVWGLGQAANRTLPTIVDTPLGRLDGDHRKSLVEYYFPLASHQVILLSTDEEINGHYYELLRPHVAKSYLLSYNAKERTSRLAEGYFSQKTREVA